MIRYFYERTKHILVTLRFSILSIFISLFALSMLTLMGFTYQRALFTMSYVALKLMHQASTMVLFEVQNELNHAAAVSQLSAKLIGSGIVQPAHISELQHYESSLLPPSSKNISENPASHFILVPEENNKNSPLIQRYVDNNSHHLTSKHDDPYQRPWYIAAKKAGETVWTDVFINQYGFLNISVATPVYKNKELYGVYALDMRLDFLRHFIENINVTKHAIIYIVTRQGKIIAFPQLEQFRNNNLLDIHSIFSTPWVVAAFDYYRKTGFNQFIFHYNNVEYVATFEALPASFKKDWLISIVIPASDFIAQLHKTYLLTAVVGFLILILGIGLVSILTSLVVNPLRRITQEIVRVKHFNLEGEVHVQSRIKEISYIADATNAMKHALRSFQKYVPASLVRQLIKAGEDAHIGGTRKTLVIFFSDIKNFTTISEAINPEELTGHIGNYFNELSKIIVQEKGTIDKYIGDSMMAFWGAPLPEENPCQHAARAALKFAKLLVELNAKWQAEGKPELLTRMSIHMGEAVVGNFGSSERFNYTAIGDSINLANRLEGANKIYGTQIIVSDTVYEVIKDQFILRKLDRVKLRGKVEINTIYELIAMDHEQLTYDLEAYSNYFEQALFSYRNRVWDEAIEYFAKCLHIYPEDQVAPLFIKRSEHFKLNPPSQHWDGVHHMN